MDISIVVCLLGLFSDVKLSFRSACILLPSFPKPWRTMYRVVSLISFVYSFWLVLLLFFWGPSYIAIYLCSNFSINVPLRIAFFALPYAIFSFSFDSKNLYQMARSFFSNVMFHLNVWRLGSSSTSLHVCLKALVPIRFPPCSVLQGSESAVSPRGILLAEFQL